jgi:hypothetical protein
MKRVYHPSLSAWQDVADDAVESWKDAGWLKSKPKHVDDSSAPKPGEGYEPPATVDISGNAGAYLNVPETPAPEPAKADEK